MNGRIWKRLAGVTLASVIGTGSASAQAVNPQDAFKPVLNDGADQPGALKFDWPMLSIGTGQYEEGPTGVTVIRFGKKVLAAIDVRGGGPGTVNSDYLRLGYAEPDLDAIVFSGGSWYGLENVTAVNTGLKDDGEVSGVTNQVGLTVGSIIYDFGTRRLNEIYPDKRLAQAALRAAQPGVFPIGPYGAGRLAKHGSAFGCNVHSGQGAAFRQWGDIKIAVFTVVNAIGVVTDRDGNVVACNRAPGWPKTGPIKVADLMHNAPDSLQKTWNGPLLEAPERRNTTVSLVVTNRKLTHAELQRVAVQVHTSMSRAIQPFATEADGDVLYAVSTDEVEGKPGEAPASLEIGTAASELMWDAVLSAVPKQPVAAKIATKPVTTAAGLASYAGVYKFSDLVTLTVTAEGDKLFGQATSHRDVFAIGRAAKTELKAVSANAFTVAGRYPLLLRFEAGKLVINPGRWQQTASRAPL